MNSGSKYGTYLASCAAYRAWHRPRRRSLADGSPRAPAPQTLLHRRERGERGRAEIRAIGVAEEHERPVSAQIRVARKAGPALIDQAKIRQRAARARDRCRSRARSAALVWRHSSRGADAARAAAMHDEREGQRSSIEDVMRRLSHTPRKPAAAETRRRGHRAVRARAARARACISATAPTTRATRPPSWCSSSRGSRTTQGAPPTASS